MGLKKKGGNHGGGGGHDAAGGMRWLLTYADLITLLLVFFIIVAAMSKPDAEKMRQLSEALSAAFSPFWSDRPFLMPGEGSGKGIRTPAGAALERGNPTLVPMIQEAATLLPDNRRVTIQFYSDRIIVGLTAVDLFNPDLVTLRDDARPFLQRLSDLIKTIRYQIDVAAYRTAPQPAGFTDLMALTSQQSVTLARYLTGECAVDSRFVSAISLGANTDRIGINRRDLIPEGGITFVFSEKPQQFEAQ